MKFDEINWMEWPGSPSEQVFNDWIKARKSKKHPALTHTAMSKYSKHVSRAIETGVCTIEEAFEYAAEGGWRAIMYQYLITAKSREMDLYSGTQHVATYNESNGSTRGMTLEQELNDTSWAKYE
jgi:hypothetical protein